MKYVELYTDGGCRGNGQAGDNIGAIGGILIYPEKNIRKEYKKAYPNTTNNQMELLAVITGLKTVSYTHLDVYKRQLWYWVAVQWHSLVRRLT